MAISSKRRRNSSNNMIISHHHHLPEEVIEEILIRLPFKPILRFECVCKSWFNLIKDRRLISKNLMESDAASFFPFCFIHKSKEDSNVSLSLFLFHDNDVEEYASSARRLTRFRKGVGRWLDAAVCNDPLPLLDCKLPSSWGEFTPSKPLELMGNCNGIMCFLHLDFILLVNPLLKEVKPLPKPINFISPMINPSLVGIGFDNINTIDFKVVRLYSQYYFRKEAQVYNLKTNVWRKLKLPYRFQTSIKRSTFFNGVIYWCVEACVPVSSLRWRLLSFNMATELFELMDLPPNLDMLTERPLPPIDLFVFNQNSLALVNYTSSLSTLTAGVWTMNNKHEEENTPTWIRLYSIKNMPPQFNKPISFWKKDKLLCQTKHGGLVLYDLRRGRWSLVSDYSLSSQHEDDLGSEFCFMVQAGILSASRLVSMNM